MSRGYKISLFFVCTIVLILIALILMKRHGLYQFDEKYFDKHRGYRLYKF